MSLPYDSHHLLCQAPRVIAVLHCHWADVGLYSKDEQLAQLRDVFLSVRQNLGTCVMCYGQDDPDITTFRVDTNL